MEFVEWLQVEGGYVHPHICLFHSFENDKRGILATDTIEEGQHLLLVPSHASLYWPQNKDEAIYECTPSHSNNTTAPWTLCNELLVSALDNCKASMTPFASAVLLLLGEMHSAASNFKQYISILPSGMLDCLIAWSPDELAELQGTTMESFDSSAFQSLYDSQIFPFIHQNPKLFRMDSVSYEDILHVACLVQSRAFHLQKNNWVTQSIVDSDNLFIIPGIDMVNHSCSKKERNATLCRLEYAPPLGLREIASSGNGRKTAWFFSLKADRRIEAGEEVLHTYGDLSDGELLSIYGFVGSTEKNRNPNGNVALAFDSIVECCISTAQRENWEIGLIAKKRDLLHRHNLGSTSPGAWCLITAETPLPDSLLTIVQAVLLPDVEFRSLDVPGPEESTLDLGRGYLGASDWSEIALFALLKVIEVSMQRYPPLNRNFEILWNESLLSQRKKLALLLRSSELEILAQAKLEIVQLLLDNESGDSDGCVSAMKSGASDESSESDGIAPKRTRLL